MESYKGTFEEAKVKMGKSLHKIGKGYQENFRTCKRLLMLYAQETLTL